MIAYTLQGKGYLCFAAQSGAQNAYWLEITARYVVAETLGSVIEPHHTTPLRACLPLCLEVGEDS